MAMLDNQMVIHSFLGSPTFISMSICVAVDLSLSLYLYIYIYLYIVYMYVCVCMDMRRVGVMFSLLTPSYPLG